MENRIRTLAVDDEPLALKQLATYIKNISFLELVGECQNAIEAKREIERQTVDAIFIDINMPDMSGLDFVRSLEVKPLVVFTTAYSDYAIEGYKVEAIDYLLKPFSQEELMAAAKSLKRQYVLLQQAKTNVSLADNDTLFLKNEYKIKEEDEFYCTFAQSVRTISSRRIVSITIDYNGQEIEFYSCHMNLPNCETEDMGKSIQNILTRTKNDNLKILMGDFNTDAIGSSEDYKNIISQGLFDTYTLAEKKDSGITVDKSIDGWANDKSQKRIDYIFSNKEIKVKESKVIFNNENKKIVSDHFGVEVEIEL